jgi:hypothetical protein
MTSTGASQPPSDGTPAAREPWLRRFGRRNLAYIVFVFATIGFGIALEASGPGGPDRGGGVGAGLMLWGAGSIGFLAVNAVLVAVDVTRHRSPRKALIACALPLGITLVFLILAQIRFD